MPEFLDIAKLVAVGVLGLEVAEGADAGTEGDHALEHVRVAQCLVVAEVGAAVIGEEAGHRE
ncbi:hypothetical protein D3C71_1866830 [compost metagenome]